MPGYNNIIMHIPHPRMTVDEERDDGSKVNDGRRYAQITNELINIIIIINH